MARVTGISGVSFKSEDPRALQKIYVEHLGLSSDHPGFVVMSWGDAGGTTIWSLFPADTDYFGSSASQCMVNYRVDHLDELLAKLRARGFASTTNGGREREVRLGVGTPRTRKIELWEPPPGRQVKRNAGRHASVTPCIRNRFKVCPGARRSPIRPGRPRGWGSKPHHSETRPPRNARKPGWSRRRRTGSRPRTRIRPSNRCRTWQ